MGLFSSGSNDTDDGCTAHHWGEYETRWDKTRLLGVRKSTETNMWHKGRSTDDAEHIFGDIERGYFELQTYTVAHCQHEGCDESDTRLGSKLYVPIGAARLDKFDALDLHDTLEDKS
jgi:hypothetical protein